MLDINIETHGGSIPLATLSELVGIRAGQLNQSVKDSAVAAMINVLVSLRKLTKKAKLNAKTSPKVELQSQYIPSFTSKKGEKGHIPCLRDASGHRVIPPVPVRWTEKSGKFKNLKVYLVTPEYNKYKPYLVVAKSESVARKFEDAKVKRRIRKYSGLARHAITLLSKSLHAQNPGGESASAVINGVAEKFTESRIDEAENSCTVSVTDSLDYAMSALNGGKGALDEAIKKAANKVAGLISHSLKKCGISRKWEAPFPEVKSIRK
ncbi:MAG: hypothetical protein IJR99_06920 [Kiritimatiellae bacterium]|nr:hypothetical protein [Kiritimatiellia bacterium]